MVKKRGKIKSGEAAEELIAALPLRQVQEFFSVRWSGAKAAKLPPAAGLGLEASHLARRDEHPLDHRPLV
jgi:hypothetical protein